MRMNRCFLGGAFRARWSAVLTALTVLAWCSGCGPGGPPTGSVSGKVTYKGQPLTTGVVTFINEKAGSGASSDLDPSGSYHIESIRTGDYNVAVHRRPPLLSEGPKVFENWKLSIPDKYQDHQTSGLTVTVEEGRKTADFGL